MMRLPRPRAVLALPVLLLCGLSAAASGASRPPAAPMPTASVLYDRSLEAGEQYSYRGRETITDWTTGRTEALIVSHLAPSLRRLDYVSPERRAGLVFLSNGREEWHYDPHRGEVDHYQLAPNAEAVSDAAYDYSVLQANYVVTVAPRMQTWAGRKVFLLTVSHKGNLKAARRLWIDAATGLVLKADSYEEFQEDGRERAKLAVTEAFTDINFHPRIPRASFDAAALTARPGVRVVEHAASAEMPIPVASVRRQFDGAWVTPDSLVGFRLVSAATAARPRPLLHLRYSDGLNLVSLFEQQRQETRLPTRVPHSRPLRVGGLRARLVFKSPYTVLNWDTPRLNLSLVGEIPLPLRTLEQLATAVDGRRP